MTWLRLVETVIYPQPWFDRSDCIEALHRRSELTMSGTGYVYRSY